MTDPIGLNIIWKENKVAVLEWDLVNEKVNKLHSQVLNSLKEIMNTLEKENCKAAVFISRKPRIFIAGADIKEIQSLSKSEFETVLLQAHELFNFIEDVSFPTICAIEGACLGGGLELALACDYRIASDDASTVIGLPEVKLGLIPGFGGCFRLPRLVGLVQSLDLIATGRALKGKKALRIGLVDECVPSVMLEKRALKFATTLPKKRKTYFRAKGLVSRVMNSQTLKLAMSVGAKKKILETTKGFYPAPLEALSTIIKGYGSSRDVALAHEVAAFCRVVNTDVSRNLIRLFFATEAVKKNPFSPGTKTLAPEFVGVLGAGTMGAGIAYTAANKGLRARVMDISSEMLVRAKKGSYKLWSKSVKRRRLEKTEFEKRKNLISFTQDNLTLQGADVIIEAATEDPKIKSKILSSIKARPDTVIATNTSSMRVSDLAKCYKYPENFVGLHFFNPVPKMPLVEIIRGNQSSEEALSKVFQLSKSMGKMAIEVKDSPLFLVNRILVPYLIESIRLVREGVSFSKIDKIYEDFGMPMGPCRLCDEVGFGVAQKVFSNYLSNFTYMGREEFWSVPDDAQGVSTLKGFYTYNAKKQKVSENESMYAKMNVKARVTSLSDEDIFQRGLFLMVNEAARAFVEEHIIEDTLLFDLATIMGIGFPPFRGGLLKYADDVGVDRVIQSLKIYQNKYGDHFSPSKGLLSLHKKSFLQA